MLSAREEKADGDPCCDPNCCMGGFIELLPEQIAKRDSGEEGFHSHYCFGHCKRPIHGLCGQRFDEKSETRRVCPQCVSEAGAAMQVQHANLIFLRDVYPLIYPDIFREYNNDA